MKELHTERIAIRVTHKEKEAFLAQARELGLTLTAWIRSSLRLEADLIQSERPNPEVSMKLPEWQGPPNPNPKPEEQFPEVS